MARLFIDGHCIMCRRVNQAEKAFELYSSRAGGHNFSLGRNGRMATENYMYANIGICTYYRGGGPSKSSLSDSDVFGTTCAEKSGHQDLSLQALSIGIVKVLRLVVVNDLSYAKRRQWAEQTRQKIRYEMCDRRDVLRSVSRR
jgi:hypothetical protein